MNNHKHPLKIGDKVRVASGFTQLGTGTVKDYGQPGSGVVAVLWDGARFTRNALADHLVAATQ